MSRGASPQRPIAHSRVELVLRTMMIVALLLLVHEIVATHAPRSWRETMLFQSQWIGGTDTAAVLVAGSIAAFIARREFALSLRPLLRYNSGYRPSKLGLPESVGRVWCVDVSNTGRAVAIITEVAYDLELEVDPPVRLARVPFAEMLAALETIGFRDEEDFVLNEWSVGTSVRDGEDRRMWEIPDKVRAKIRTLRVHLTYASVLGETFETHVSAFRSGRQPRS